MVDGCRTAWIGKEEDGGRGMECVPILEPFPAPQKVPKNCKELHILAKMFLRLLF